MLEQFLPFLDPEGRISDKPRKQEDGVTDNPLLFTGEVAILLKLLGKSNHELVIELQKIIDNCRVVPGLYRRHPTWYQEKYSIPWNSVSHDEYNGICFMVTACPDLMRQYASYIVEYGESYGWQYNDLYPRTNFFNSLKASPIKTLVKLSDYFKDIKANPADTNSVDLWHEGDITAFSRLRQPRDIAFYLLAAARTPSLFSQIYLAISTALSSRATLDDGKRGGTALMVWFRIQAMRLLKNEPFIVRLGNLFFEYKMSKKYGSNYMSLLAKKYFDRMDGDTVHPIRTLIDEAIKTDKILKR